MDVRKPTNTRASRKWPLQVPPDNPYAPPDANLVEEPGTDSLAAMVELRKSHIATETSIKTIALLTVVGGGAQMLQGVRGLLEGGGRHWLWYGSTAVMGLGILVAGTLLRRLRRSGRVLFSIAVGTPVLVILLSMEPWVLLPYILPGLMLVYIWTPRGSRILSTHYRDVVVPATSQVKYRNVIAWVLFALVCAAILATLIAPML